MRVIMSHPCGAYAAYIVSQTTNSAYFTPLPAADPTAVELRRLVVGDDQLLADATWGDGDVEGVISDGKCEDTLCSTVFTCTKDTTIYTCTGLPSLPDDFNIFFLEMSGDEPANLGIWQDSFVGM